MKRSNLMFLVLGVTIIFFGCSEDNVAPEFDQSDQATTFDQVTNSMESARKPSPNLTGTMMLYFNDITFDPIWEGTISLEGTVYGMRFFSLPTFKDKNYSQARPFAETFEIYDLVDDTKVYLGGADEGVTTLANSKYRMNGEIVEATAPFEEWLGRKVHMSGDITWQDSGFPATAPGTLRIN